MNSVSGAVATGLAAAVLIAPVVALAVSVPALILTLVLHLVFGVSGLTALLVSFGIPVISVSALVGLITAGKTVSR